MTILALGAQLGSGKQEEIDDANNETRCPIYTLIIYKERIRAFERTPMDGSERRPFTTEMPTFRVPVS